MKGTKRNWKIGNFNNNTYRKRVTPARVGNYLDEMSRDFSDYDVYLWGSWPDRKNTWDLDLFLYNDSLNKNTEKMENISLNSLKNSLAKNQFLADLGFAGNKNSILPFKTIMSQYNKNGKKTPVVGYVYGDKWYADNKIIKDRMKFKNGVVQQLDNNMLSVNSSIPYHKMLNRGETNFNKYYANKPMLISERNKVYGSV